MEALATGSAIVGVVAAGLHATRLLLNDIERLKDVPEVLALTRQELQTVEGVLQAVSATIDGEEELPPRLKNLIESTQVKAAVQACADCCSSFRAKLQKWTQNSKDNKLDWRDRFRIGFLGEAAVQSFLRQMNANKSTLMTALNATNTIILIRDQLQSEPEEAVLDAETVQVDTRTQDLSRQITDTESIITELQNAPSREAQPSNPDEPDAIELLKDRQRELQLLQNANQVCEEVKRTIEQERIRIRVDNVTGKDGGQVMVGAFGVSKDNEPTVTIHATNSYAESKGSKLGIGVYQNFDANAWMRDD